MSVDIIFPRAHTHIYCNHGPPARGRHGKGHDISLSNRTADVQEGPRYGEAQWHFNETNVVRW